MKSSADERTRVSDWIEYRHHPLAVSAMLLILAVLVGLTAFRTYRNYSTPSVEFSWVNRGYSDFHNGTYFPTKAFVDGKSPYSPDVANEYGMARATPSYSPVVFLIHVPFALLPLQVSRVLFFGFNLVLIAGLAFCGLKMSMQRFRWFDFLAFTNLLLLSRPGHITIFTGYFTAEIVVGCILALHFSKTRPAISGLGLVLASIKPNFVIPLMLLMAFRKDFRAILFGIVFCAVAAGIGLGWLGYHNGMSQVIADVRGGQESLHVDPSEMPVNTWTRVDLLGMYAKVVDWVPRDGVYLGCMFVLVTLVGVGMNRIVAIESNQGATGPSALIVVLTVLLSIYHHSYDCLLLAVPAIGLIFFGPTTLKEIPPRIRLVLAFLIAVPAVNYLSTKMVLEFLAFEPLGVTWQAITMINGVCLFFALGILLVASARKLDVGK